MYDDRHLQLRPLGAFLVVLSVFGLSGCGAGETPAEFAGGGSAADPLDGSVISDDGQEFTLRTEGATLTKVEISPGQAEIGFDRGPGGSSQVAAVNRIQTGSGDVAEYDAERQILTITVDFPFVGEQTVSVPTGDLLDEVFGGTNQRASNQLDTDCEEIVSSVDGFCTAYLETAEATLENVIDLALAQADAAGIPSIVFGQIRSAVTSFFDVIQGFCEAWDELRAGTDMTDPVDPCNLDG